MVVLTEWLGPIPEVMAVASTCGHMIQFKVKFRHWAVHLNLCFISRGTKKMAKISWDVRVLNNESIGVQGCDDGWNWVHYWTGDMRLFPHCILGLGRWDCELLGSHNCGFVQFYTRPQQPLAWLPNLTAVTPAQDHLQLPAAYTLTLRGPRLTICNLHSATEIGTTRIAVTKQCGHVMTHFMTTLFRTEIPVQITVVTWGLLVLPFHFTY